MPPVDPRWALSGCDLEIFPPERGPDCDVEGGGQADIERLRQVQGGDGLGALEPTRKKGKLVRDAGVVGSTEHTVGPGRAGRDEAGTERGVVRVFEIVVESVLTERAAKVE